MSVQYSEILKRRIRKDPVTELGISTVTKVLEAIDNNRLSEAKELVEYLWLEGKGLHDLYSDWCWAFMDYIAERLGEEELFRALKKTQEQRVQLRAEMHRKTSLEERIQLRTEFIRAHRSGPDRLGTAVIREEDNRYVIERDPCGSGGRMRRGDLLAGTPPHTEAPYNFGVVKGAYPWTWSKPNVARYCVHCCVNEIIDIETIGYLTAICEYPDDPNHPCRMLFYKNPKDIPAEFYTRVGKVKPSLAELERLIKR